MRTCCSSRSMASQRSSARPSPLTAGTTRQLLGITPPQTVETSRQFGSTTRQTKCAPLQATKALRTLSLRVIVIAPMTSMRQPGPHADQPSWTAIALPPVSNSTLPSSMASALLLGEHLTLLHEPSILYACFRYLQRIRQGILLICLVKSLRFKVLAS